MARRSEDWNVGLAKDLRDAAFAREFLLASIDEGVDLQLALGKVIRAMGVKEFAGKVHMAAPNVLRAIGAFLEMNEGRLTVTEAGRVLGETMVRAFTTPG